MSQKDDSENGIWEYKPLEKRKKRGESLSASAKVSKRLCTSRKAPKRDSAGSSNTKAAENGACFTDADTPVDGHSSTGAQTLPSKSSLVNDSGPTDSGAEGTSSGDFCPVCQMPFTLLVVQTQRWHVAECLDTPSDTCKGTDVHVSGDLLNDIHLIADNVKANVFIC